MIDWAMIRIFPTRRVHVSEREKTSDVDGSVSICVRKSP